MRKNYLTLLLGMLGGLGAAHAQIAFTNGSSALTVPNYSGVTVAIGDVDGDRLDDLIRLNQGYELNFQFQKMNGTFSALASGDVSNESQWGIVVGDADNNGKSDVVSGGSYDNVHYSRANTAGTVYTTTNLANSSLFLQACSFADINNDGWLDFFGCHDDGPSKIYMNNGSGNLVYNTTVMNTAPFDGGNANNNSGNYGNVWSDFDDDGDIDLYIAHCRQGVNSPTDSRRINTLFLNNGNGTYTESAATYGLAFGAQSWTADFGDIDNDGDLDIFITNHDVSAMLLVNDGSQSYTDIYATSGITNMVGFPLQGIFKDFDNDGYLDIIVSGDAHRVYRNNGNNTFTQVTNPFNASIIESFAVGDLNHDGFLDVYASYAEIYTTPSNTPDALWINSGNDNNWIAFDLQGTVSNRDAIGAKIKVYSDLGVQVREVRAGESYGICNSLTQHFGLGEVTTVDSVVIRFPSGIVEKLYDLEPGQFVSVIEDECTLTDAFISANGGGILCAGQTLALNAPAGYTYLWSNNATTQSINVTATGDYMVQLTSPNGCSATSALFPVVVAPDETPSVAVTGDLEICEGSSVTLTSSSAAGYSWNIGGGTSQSIDATQPGDYTVTIQGVCGSFTSDPITVTQLAAPAPAVGSNDVYIPVAGTANLSATGSVLNWYDQPTGGTVLGTGNSFTTPVVNTQDFFYVEEVFTFGGATEYGGRPDNSGTGQYQNNSSFYLVFDVLEESILNSVKVYANGAGNRTIRLFDNSGAQVDELVVNIPNGESRVDLNFQLDPGTGYSLRTVGDPQLWRNAPNAPMNYPYNVGSMVSITGTNVTGANTYNYYYYFYDWEVSSPERVCVSPRTEVSVTVGTVGLAEGELIGTSVYPNPTTDNLNVVIPTSVKGNISMDVFSSTGQRVMSGRLAAGTARVDVSGLASGVYSFRINSDNGQYTQRIVVH